VESCGVRIISEFDLMEEIR